MSTKDLLHRLLALALGLAAVVACGELALRLAGPGARFVNTAVPGGSRIRDHLLPDFRDRPPPAAKAPGVFRVLALGDSFTWGFGVHPRDSWPRRLECRLDSLESARRFEVVSWSRSGWNVEQAWHSVRDELAGLAPDLVLLGFTLNDPEPSDRRLRRRLGEPLQRREPEAAWSRLLHRHSVLYRLLWERLENRRQRRAFSAYYEGLYQGPGWADCLAALVELRRATRELGAELVLVVFPVFDSQLDHRYAYRRLHRKIAAATDELGMPLVDLLATFRRVDARRLAVRPFSDPHPDELAHRIAADELTNYLVERGLVPAAYPAGSEPIPAVRRR